jgi:hypothetical protein
MSTCGNIGQELGEAALPLIEINDINPWLLTNDNKLFS